MDYAIEHNCSTGRATSRPISVNEKVMLDNAEAQEKAADVRRADHAAKLDIVRKAAITNPAMAALLDVMGLSL